MARAKSVVAALGKAEIDQIGINPLFDVSRDGPAKFVLKKSAPVCDLVMKGGVTSGVVYPYAILRVAQKFRLAGIGGTSAGAIAAALTAAAEYGRQVQGDGSAYSRFEERCAELPKVLPHLFQPYPKHRPIFAFATTLMELFDAGVGGWAKARAVGRLLLLSPAALLTWTVLIGSFLAGALASARYIWAYGRGIGRGPEAIWFQPGIDTALVGGAVGIASGILLLASFIWAITITARFPMWLYLAFVIGAALVSIREPLGGLYAVVAPSALGGALGMVAATFFIGDQAIGNLRTTDFGLCSGLRRKPSDKMAVTDWLHEAIQYVAGRAATDPPLTFGDIENAVADPKAPRLALRMITTNLTLRRPYALPDIGGAKGRVGWAPREWRLLFPKPVVDHLVAAGPGGLSDDKVRPLPYGLQLPVVVGARMSLSFPILFSGVPVHELSVRGKARARMLLVDGGLSSNLPLHFFDSLGPPAYPTFAFNLDDDPKAGSEENRVSLHRPGQRPPTLKPLPVSNVIGYLNGLLGAAKDWQDNLVSIMPGHFDRIVRIRLAKGEGGLNLVMPEERSRLLMRLGYRAGNELTENFDLAAHRVRRALAAYQEIERTAKTFGANWKSGRLMDALTAANAPVGSRQAWRLSSKHIISRFETLATWSAALKPPAWNKHFPRPRGSLRITPNLSGDN